MAAFVVVNWQFFHCEAFRSKLEDLHIYDCLEIQLVRPKLEDKFAWSAPHCSAILHFASLDQCHYCISKLNGVIEPGITAQDRPLAVQLAKAPPHRPPAQEAPAPPRPPAQEAPAPEAFPPIPLLFQGCNAHRPPEAPGLEAFPYLAGHIPLAHQVPQGRVGPSSSAQVPAACAKSSGPPKLIPTRASAPLPSPSSDERPWRVSPAQMPPPPPPEAEPNLEAPAESKASPPTAPDETWLIRGHKYMSLMIF